MPEEPLPSSFGALLRDLVAWLEDVRVEGVVERTQAWIREFSAALDRPEIFEDFQAIVRRRPS